MRFEFATAARIVFGKGTVKELAPAAKSFGNRALLVSGKSVRRVLELMGQLKEVGVTVSEFNISGEPTVTVVTSGLQQAKAEHCDLVISIGGGSVIDAGKAIAGLMSNPGQIYDYLEVVGMGKPLSNQSLPFIAIPTTAGTGSEVTRNAVLTVTEQKIKVSLRSPTMLPRLAIVDPELTYSLPPEITAATGMDALTQLIEPFLSIAPNPITDSICREGLRYISRSLRRAYEHGDDVDARKDMAIASLLGGMALANAKLGAVHGFAGPIGGAFPAPHGVLCARLLPLVVKMNLKTIRERDDDLPVIERFTEMSRLLTGDQNACAEDGIKWLDELCKALKVPPLATYGILKSDFPEIISQARKTSSMKGNPIELTDYELSQILELAF
jgi:alcohol dehydrogenase class IV